MQLSEKDNILREGKRFMAILTKFPYHYEFNKLLKEMVIEDSDKNKHVVFYTPPILDGGKIMRTDRVFKESDGLNGYNLQREKALAQIYADFVWWLAYDKKNLDYFIEYLKEHDDNFEEHTT